MTFCNMDYIFKPNSIAIIGTREVEVNMSFRIFQNLIDSGYSGDIYPAGLKQKKIWGGKGISSLKDIKSQVDLVISTAPITSVPLLLKECVSLGSKGILLISDKRTDNDPREKEAREAIKKKADNMGIRIIGPSCFGIICSSSKLNASFSRYMPRTGKTAFISQSGAICSSILDLSIRDQIGFSHFICIGSMLDIGLGDLIDYLGNDSGASSIVIQMEKIDRIRNFMSAARSVSRIKPIIVLKSGRSHSISASGSPFINSLIDEDAVYDTSLQMHCKAKGLERSY